MSRFIKEIKDELEMVNLRLNMVIEERDMINNKGSALDDRRTDLKRELEVAERELHNE